jgi:hypothetical protein
MLRAFPRLRKNRNWRLRSPRSDTYQCIAYAGCRTDNKWWPVVHPQFVWPSDLPRIVPNLWGLWPPTPVDYFTQRFARLGYEACSDRSFEFGYQKVAIYANDNGATHMARQRFFGRGWISKPGELEDIIHRDLSDIEGDMAVNMMTYGQVSQVLRRSWWRAMTNGCLFRCFWHTAKFALLRVWWCLLKLKWKRTPYISAW